MKKTICFISLLFALFCRAQVSSHTIRGLILSAPDNIPLQGAVITMQGSGKSAIVQADGSFTVTANSPADTIQVSYSNYQLYKKAITASTPMPLYISLQPPVKSLNEVVINTGYQTLPKERATGSFEKIDSKLFNEQAGTNVLSRLEAIATGVYFEKKTLAPQDNITVRGLSSILGPKGPLVILDNFPYEGDFNNINPNDVESITILKDAAAASIWGTRAGNGVIVITTKKGKFNQPVKIEMNNSISITQKPNLFYINNISSPGFIAVERFLYDQGFFNNQLSSPYRPPLSPVVEILIKKTNGSLTPQQADDKINEFSNLDLRNDFNKYVYQKQVNRQHALNIRGGGNNIAWIFSAGLDENVGNLAEKYARLSLRTENTFKISTRLQLTAAAVYTHAKNTGGRQGYYDVLPTDGNLPVYTQLADADGNALPVIRNYRQAYIDTAGAGKLLNWNYYPLTDYRSVNNSTSLQSLLGMLSLDYKVNRNFSGTIKYQYEKQDAGTAILYSPDSYFTRNLVNSFSQLNRSTGVVTYKIPKGAILSNSDNNTLANNIRGQLSFNKRWAVHEITAIAGGELRESRNTGNSYRAYGYNEDILTTSTVDYSTPFPNFITGITSNIPGNISFTGKTNRFVSTFINAAYSYRSRYNLSASARRDASNLFGVNTNNKWTPLWSAGIGWDISSEPFYHVKALPLLKLRISTGVSGNADPSRSAQTTLAYISNSVYTQVPIARVDQYGNPGLRWERAGMFNIGIDFKTAGNRVQGSVEYYHKKGTDLLGSAPADYTSVGVDVLTKNVAAMKANGWDLNVTGINTRGIINWSTNLNLSFNREKVTDYYLPSQPGSNFVGGGLSISPLVGKPVYGVYAFRWAGLDPLTGDPLGYVNGAVSRDYSAIMGAQTRITDLVYFGSALPTVFGALGNTISWKDLSLTARLTYKFGYWFQRAALNYNLLFNNRIGNSEFDRRWQQPGDEAFTNVPSMVYPANSQRDAFYTNSEIQVCRGDHIRLQYITLSWNTKAAFKKTAPAAGLQFYVNINNLGIIWRANKYGIDPDYRNNTILPAKNYVAGLRISL